MTLENPLSILISSEAKSAFSRKKPFSSLLYLNCTEPALRSSGLSEDPQFCVLCRELAYVRLLKSQRPQSSLGTLARGRLGKEHYILDVLEIRLEDLDS